MMVLARQYARGLLWLTIGYFAILEAAMVAAILYWPKFRDNTPALAKLIPFQALQDLLTAVQQSGYWPYFAIQQWFKGCSLFLVLVPMFYSLLLFTLSARYASTLIMLLFFLFHEFITKVT